MNNQEIEAKASELRKEAVNVLNRQFGIPDNFSSLNLERFVDCVIEAAVLKASIWNPTIHRQEGV